MVTVNKFLLKLLEKEAYTSLAAEFFNQELPNGIDYHLGIPIDFKIDSIANFFFAKIGQAQSFGDEPYLEGPGILIHI